ncbi:MAG: LamG-like jellyroll fold domain-containing protein [Anaerolineaceae bacterium]
MKRALPWAKMSFRWVSILIAIGFIPVFISFSQILIKEQPKEKVETAWMNLQKAGEYSFSTVVEQEIHPAPALTNVGSSAKRDIYYLEGNADLGNNELFMRLFQDSSSLTDKSDSIEIRIENGETHGRSQDSEWIKLDTFSTEGFAPGNDFSSFLTSATNVKYIKSEKRNITEKNGQRNSILVNHFSFNIDSPRFAVYMRDQMVKEYQRAGKLPLGMELSISDEYRNMVSKGEVWISEDGYPIHMEISMLMPQEENGEQVEALVKTDFTSIARGKLIASLPLPVRITSTLGLILPTEQWQEKVFASSGAILFCFGIFWMCSQSRKKLVNIVISVLLILLFLFTPLWQSYQTVVFASELEERQTLIKTKQDEAKSEKEVFETLYSSDWNPHQAPSADTTTNLSIASSEINSGTPLSISLSPLYQTSEDEEIADRDQDGLTDEYESGFELSILNPDDPDTDDDGLLDGEEMKLGTAPGNADSDGDGILDFDEVNSFYYRNANTPEQESGDWYSDPTNRDTDRDGLLDGVECDQRVLDDDTTTAGVCQDQDQDGYPDIFDTDDDGDGVPTIVDADPNGSVTELFDANNPLEMSIRNIADGLPVFVEYQLRPNNPKHLTYILNVLDWPNEDDDGQIQRVTNSTFGDEMSSASLEADPRPSFGDLRLIPMVEITSKNNIPFELTNSFTTIIESEDFQGELKFTSVNIGGSMQTEVKLLSSPAETYRIYFGVGDCDKSSNLQLIGSYIQGTSHNINVNLGSVAESQYAFFVKDASDSNYLACSVPLHAHGNLPNQVVNTGMIEAYGGFVRDDAQGNVLSYLPLSVLNDISGNNPVAFTVKVPLTNQNNRLNQTNMEVRMVWLLNMLTDVCKPMQEGYTETDDKPWCDPKIGDRWYTDIARVVHSYNDEFKLTGATIVEDHGMDMSVIFEDPQIDPEPEFDDPLWKISYGLQGTFLAGRSDFDITDITERFDREDGIFSDGSQELWGIPEDSFQVENYHYDYYDQFQKFSSEQVHTLFETYFPGAITDSGYTFTNLLFARQFNQRSVSIGTEAGNCSDGICVFDFNGVGTLTNTLLNWAPYHFIDNSWKTSPLESSLDLLESRIRSLEDFQSSDETRDERNFVDGQIYIIRYYYQNLFYGMAGLVALNGDPISNPAAEMSDINLYDGFFSLQKKGSAASKIVGMLAGAVVNGLDNNLSAWILFNLGNKTDKVRGFFIALGDGLQQKASKFANLFKNTLLKVIAGIVLAAIVVAIIVIAVIYLTDPNSPTGKILGKILTATMSVVAILASVMTLKEVIPLVQAGKALSNSLKTAAVIGAIIAGVITWGIFIYQWASSGMSAGSLQFNSALADAIAATMTIILMAALACTGVGAIIVAVVAIIDAIITAFCAAFGVYDREDDDIAKQYVCIGISGWVTKIFKWFIYSNTYLIDYDNGDRLEFNGVETDYQNKYLGIAQGNHMSVEVSITNTVTLSDVPFDWKAAAYFWQYSNKNAKTSTFAYKVQAGENDIHENLSRGSMKDVWQSAGSDMWSAEFVAKTDGYDIELPVAGINRDPIANVSEGSAVPVQECWVIPPIFPIMFPIPVCYIRTEKATFQIPMDSSLTLDVFPVSLDAFYSLVEVSNGGYSLSWGRDAEKSFPIFSDADGDMLKTSQKGGNDPDDSLFDTDQDGLSDYDEISYGTNPRLFDSDDDGLYDLEELMQGTDPKRKDSDGDGLPDAVEVAGWYFTYGFYSDGSPKETMVYPNPLLPDSDLDGITDLEEKIYGFNPNVYENADILDYSLSYRELDAPIVSLTLDEFNGTTIFDDNSNFKFDAFCDGDYCPVSGLEGVYLNAVRFDGQDVLYLPTSAKQISFLNNQKFTFAAWVYPQGDGTLISKWQTGADKRQEIILELVNAHPIIRSADQSVTSNISLPQEEWSHLAASFDGTRVRFYLNGELEDSCTEGSCNWQNTHVFTSDRMASALTVGSTLDENGAPENGFTGLMDEIQVFDHTLADVELDEQSFIKTRLMTHRYNSQDSFVRPAEVIEYTSIVKNLLNSRFAYGLLNTVINGAEAIVDWTEKLIPKTFVLYPDNPVVTGVNIFNNIEQLQIQPNLDESVEVTFNQTASAQIVDRRTESNFAQIWLKFNESSTFETFIDSSGNMPPRDATCSTCPTSGQTGILNNAIRFNAGQNTPLVLPTLDTLGLIDRGITVAFWVKPNAGSTSNLTILKSSGNQLSLNLIPSGQNYLPQVYMHGSLVSLSSWRNVTGGQWNHIVLRYNDGSQVLEIYVNGARVATANAITPINSDNTLWLGGSPQGTNYLIDDLRIFNRPLTILDINLLAERPVLELKMETTSFGDSSVYNQSVSIPVQAPNQSSNSVRGYSLSPSNGSDTGFIQVNGNALLDMNDGAFTFSTWIYPQINTNGNWEGIFGKHEYNDPNHSYPTLERSGGLLRFGFGNGSSYQSKTSGNILSNNTWYQVAITFKPNGSGQYEYRLYLNSELRDSYLFSSKPVSTSTFYIGHSSSSYHGYLGTLYMDNEHDAGSNAEVYMYEDRNGSYYHSIFGDTDMEDGDTKSVDHGDTITNFAHVRYVVMEDDSTSSNDYCGDVNFYWYNWPTSGTAYLSNGFDGRLTYSLSRTSVQFIGKIDEFQVYRYAIDSELVYDLYNSIPITARLPLDDRPASDSFVNKAIIGEIDDGTCSGTNCPAAGTVGLINQAVRFDGKDDVISVPTNTTQDYMVSLWINTSCPDCGVYTLQSNSGTVLNQIYLRGGNICSTVQNTEVCTRNATLINGQWHHVVYSNNAGATSFWLDGDIVNQISGQPLVASGGGHVYLGQADLANNDYLNGQLDDVRVFRYSQAAEVVTQLLQRAPFFLSHLDDPDASDGILEDTPADWMLDCNPDSNSCPKTGMKGRLGTAMEFDGSNDYLRLRQSQLSGSIQSFSVSIWVKPTNVLSSTQTLWTLWNANNTAIKYSLGIIPNGMKLCLLTGIDPNTCDANSNVDLIMNVWNNITLTVNRDSSIQESYQLYINGYLDSSGLGARDRIISNGLGKFELGNRIEGSQAGGAYLGLIDEVSLYAYALNEIDVRDTFHYQMESVEESNSIGVTVDADNPTVELVTFNPVFPYVPDIDRIVHVEADDLTSAINAVEMIVDHDNLSSPQRFLAPVCLDSISGTAFCPTFNPQVGEGTYRVSFRAMDLVGNQTLTQPYLLLVDSTKPRVTANIIDQQVVAGRIHPELENTWVIDLSGTLQDEPLSDNSPGSGIDLESVSVTIYNQSGAKVGGGTQKPILTERTIGYGWSSSYFFPENEPTGAMTLVIKAMDNVGNLEEKAITFYLDTTAPLSNLDESSMPVVSLSDFMDGSKNGNESILTEEEMSGSASDIPGLDLIYMSENGTAAVSGVDQVQMGVHSSLGISYLYNEPYPDGLLVWLPLDKEEVPNGNDGNPDENSAVRYYLDISPYQISGECQTEDCPMAGTVGHKNGSMYFNGDHKYVNLGSQVDLSNKSFTISLWANRDVIDRNDPILWQGPLSMAQQRFLFGFNSTNQVVCGFGGKDLVTSQPYPANEWHNWACSYDHSSGQRTIWLDGKAIISDTVAPVLSMEENLYVGLAPVGSFKGYLDELVIYDRALEEQEIRQQYTAFQSVYHLSVKDSFVKGGDLLEEISGFFNRTELITSDGDITNKINAGQIGDYGLDLNGWDKLTVYPNYNLNLNRAQFTQSAWVHPFGNDKDAGIFSQWNENPEMRYPSIILTGDGAIKAGFGNGYNWVEVQTDPGLVPDNTWSLVSATFDGITYKIYLNGVLVLSDESLSGVIPYSSEQFNIGESFYGLLDEAMIFARPLSQEELFALYQMGWKEANLENNGNQVRWNATVPYGLEGSFNVNIRAWDGSGHYLSNQNSITQWGGPVDSYPPRLTVSQTEIDPENPDLVRYDFEIIDTMLDESSIHQSLCEEIVYEKEYFNSSWYLSGGIAPNSAVFHITGSCTAQKPFSENAGLTACDVAGNCSAQWFEARFPYQIYLPMITGGSGSGYESEQTSREPNPKLNEILEASKSWPTLLASQMLDEVVNKPDVWLDHSALTYVDQRSIMHLNIKGFVSNGSALQSLEIKIWSGDLLLATTQAAIFNDIWNAPWVFSPGVPPSDGNYDLEFTLTDRSGEVRTIWQTIEVELSQ